MVLINFYKIVSSNTPKVYIGSTVKTIVTRLQEHEADYKRFREGIFVYITSYDILEFKDYSIQLIESKLCETKADRDTIERYHILNNPTAVNKYQPGRLNLLGNEEYHRQYRQDNKEQAHQYRQEHKEQIAQHYRDHKEEYNARHRQYYQENKEQINQKANTKHTCQCGGKYSLKHKTHHFKTQKHITYHIHIHP